MFQVLAAPHVVIASNHLWLAIIAAGAISLAVVIAFDCERWDIIGVLVPVGVIPSAIAIMGFGDPQSNTGLWMFCAATGSASLTIWLKKCVEFSSARHKTAALFGLSHFTLAMLLFGCDFMATTSSAPTWTIASAVLFWPTLAGLPITTVVFVTLLPVWLEVQLPTQRSVRGKPAVTRTTSCGTVLRSTG